MANVLVEETSLSNIANAIRNKNGTTTKYKPNEMANAISQITTSEDLTSELTEQNTLITTQETTIDDIVSALQGKSAGSGGVEIKLQEKTVTPTTSQQNVVADSSYTGLSKVVVNAVTSSIDSDIKATNIRKGINILGVTGTLEEYKAPSLQTKTATPKTSSQTITADSGYDGLSKVTINAMPTTTQATPSISVSSSGLITASATQSAGYVSSGTKSATKQLTTKSATTITPTTSNQTIASGTYLTGTQTIKGDSNLIASNIRSGKSIFGVSGTLVEGITPSGTLDITENGTHNVTNYANVNVNVASSGDTSQEDALVMGTVEEYTNDRITSIGTGNFVMIFTLTSISCSEVTEIGDMSLYDCENLINVNFPKLETLGNNCLSDNESLETISLPNLITMGDQSMSSNYWLTNVSLPNLEEMGMMALSSCITLETLDFPKLKYIGMGGMYKCERLTTLILRSETVCVLDEMGLSGTAIAYGTGYVYVPDNLVDSYKSATNWSVYANQIKGVSEL